MVTVNINYLESSIYLSKGTSFLKEIVEKELYLHTSCLGLSSSKKTYRLTRSVLSKKPKWLRLKAALTDKFKISDKEASECGRCVSCIVLLSK